MFGSLRAKARREIRLHVSTNRELQFYRRGIWGRIIDFIFKNRGPFWFVFLYLVIVVSVILFEFFHIQFPELLKFSLSVEYAGLTHNDINRTFLALQAALIGIIFPIAIALVSVLLQQRGQMPSSSRVDIYYRESRAFEIGNSGIMLIIALIAQQFHITTNVSIMFFDSQNVQIVQTALTVTHGVWISLNALAIWQFLVVSFEFVHPDTQKIILRRFMARELPQQLEREISKWYLINHDSYGLLPRQEMMQPSVYFHDLGIGMIEVECHFNNRRILHDIRFGLLKWVILRWLKRTNLDWDSAELQIGRLAPKLIFPLRIGQKSSGHFCICRREDGSTLTRFEKNIIKFSFVFRKVKE